MLILDVDFPLLAATANPNSVDLFSVLMCVFKREHNSVETALPLFVPQTEAPCGPGLSNWPGQEFQSLCQSATGSYNAGQSVSPPLTLSLLKLPPHVLFSLPPFLAGCETRCSDSCSNDVSGGRVLLVFETNEWGRKLTPQLERFQMTGTNSSQRIYILPKKRVGRICPVVWIQDESKALSVKLHIKCSQEV